MIFGRVGSAETGKGDQRGQVQFVLPDNSDAKWLAFFHFADGDPAVGDIHLHLDPILLKQFLINHFNLIFNTFHLWVDSRNPLQNLYGDFFASLLVMLINNFLVFLQQQFFSPGDPFGQFRFAGSVFAILVLVAIFALSKRRIRNRGEKQDHENPTSPFEFECEQKWKQMIGWREVHLGDPVRR